MQPNQKLEYGGLYLLAQKIEIGDRRNPHWPTHRFFEIDVLKMHPIDPNVRLSEMDTKTNLWRKVTTTPVVHSFPVGCPVILLATGDQICEMSSEVASGFNQAGRFWMQPLDYIALILIDDMHYYTLVSWLWPPDNKELVEQLAYDSHD